MVFAAMTCVVSAETSPSPKPETGIEGVVTISPTHGGPIREGEDSSRPLPDAIFVVRKGTEEVARFTTDDQGRFQVALPPGNYEVLAREQKHKLGGWGPFPIEVEAGKMTKRNFDCDSGMR